MTTNLLALVTDPIGQITPFVPITGITPEGTPVGLISLLNAVLRIIFAVAGIWAFFNIIIAGFSFINAGGDPKKVTAAWTRIWQSLLGLLIIVTSFILAAILGILFFQDATAILNPKFKPPAP